MHLLALAAAGATGALLTLALAPDDPPLAPAVVVDVETGDGRIVRCWFRQTAVVCEHGFPGPGVVGDGYWP